MKAAVLIVALCLVAAGAQSEECPNCEIGIYDSRAMDQNWGLFQGTEKEIYLGVKFDGVVARGLSAVEFSILGLESFFTAFEADAGSNIMLGTEVKAPADLKDPAPPTIAGHVIAWPRCQTGEPNGFVFGKINLVTLGGEGSAGDNIVVSVERRFPPGDEHHAYPLFTQCNRPFYTLTEPRAACYVINPNPLPSGPFVPCQNTAVEERAWSTVKALYR